MSVWRLRDQNSMSAFLFAALLSAAAPLPAAAQEMHAFDVPAQDPATAIRTLGAQAEIQILASADDLKGKKFNPVNGEISTEEALNALLKGTGLNHRYVGERAVALVSNSGAAAVTGKAGASGSQPAAGPSSDLGGNISLAQTQSAAPSNISGGNRLTKPATGKLSQTDDGKLAEVIVTAEKRSERLQDVPVPLSVIDAQVLTDSNLLRVQDYYSTIPGLTIAPTSNSGGEVLAIRGITTGGGAIPTVGITIDDVPFGSSTYFGGGAVLPPDIDPSDLARVEVLRGPQGTLYGASSMGGLLKFVTVDPSTEQLSGRVQAGTVSVYDGAELGYSVRGSVNVPLSDAWAVRASGFTRLDPGYIDNPVLGIDGINEARADGGRLGALWHPSEELSLKFSALAQEIKNVHFPAGSSDVELPVNGYVGPPLGDLQQNYIRGVGGAYDKLQAYSATLKAKLGIADLTSTTGYNVNQHQDSFDFSSVIGTSLTEPAFGVTGTPIFSHWHTEKFSQEFRLALPVGQRADWQMGVFYTHESAELWETIAAENPANGQIVGALFNGTWPTTYQGYAAFTDVTFRFSDQFDVQLGGREEHISQTLSQIETGSPAFTSPDASGRSSKVNPFTYLLTPRLKVSRDLMVYARLASGYRPGGVNFILPAGAPATFAPDKTKNYEIGVKGDFLEHRFSIDASLYYIDWKDFQILLNDPTTGISYNTNGSGAKSQGLELSVQYKPIKDLTIGAWATWSEAVLTTALPPNSTTYGVAGDRLPYSSRFSANASLRQDIPVTYRTTAFVGGTASYVGNREGEFTGSPQRQEYPAYTKLDLLAGAHYDLWTLNLYVNNAANERGLLQGGIGSYLFLPFAFDYIQPRTIGLSLTRVF